MKRRLLLCFALLFAFGAFAQERTITGKVTAEEDGSPVPGANVVVKGTTNGTVTDANGVYKLSLPAGPAILVASFIGMQTMEVEVGDRTTVDFAMPSDVKQLTEVVVTAMNVKVDKDKFGSAVSTVGGQALTRSGETSVLTGLTGKAAGVLITRSGGDPGAGAYIQIRGQNTINGNSQPLIVIDGVPMSNTSEGTATVMQQSRLNDLNPEDIESMEVLKGASAGALWGTRAANGVIMITTKKGKDTGGKLNIEFKSTYSVDKVNKLHPLQTSYGQGQNGFYDASKTRSWGDKIADRTGGADEFLTDGAYVTFPDGTKRYSIAPGNSTNPHGGKNSRETWDHFKDVFQTGHYTDNSLSMTGGNAKSNFYLGLANLTQEGIIKKNSDYKRNSIRFNASSALTDWMRISVNTNYISMNSNRIQQGDNVDGLLLGLMRTPPDFNNNYYTGDYTDASGSTLTNRHVSYRNPLGAKVGPGYSNPIWNISNIKNTTNVDRIVGNLELSIDPTSWLNITGRSGIDNFLDKRLYNYPIYSATYNDGHLDKQYFTERQFNNDLFVKANKQFGDKFSFTAIAGVNYNSRFKEIIYTSINKFLVSDSPPLLNNALNSNLSATNETYLQRTYAYYASLTFEAFDMFFLELNGRNEAASTFGAQTKNSFFFPSASLAWQFTKLEPLKDNPILSFGKLRLAYGQVGIQPTPYRDKTTFGGAAYYDAYASSLIGTSDQYQGGYVRSYTYGNPGLKPEIKSETELGVDLRFLNDRLSFSFTAYKTETKDLILQLQTAPSTGYTSQWKNAGSLTNKGLEAEMTYTVLQTGDFTWKLNANWSANRNKVVSLAGSDAQWIGYEAAIVEGQPFGVFYDVDFQKDESGKYILDANGFPQGGTTPEVIGNPNPKWRAGIGSSFTYKNFGLNFLFDAVYGNDIWSGAHGALYNFGTHADVGHESVSNVDLKTNQGVVIPAGTPFRGNIHDFGGGPVALTQTWYDGGGGGGFDGASQKQFVYDGSLVRLREIGLTYSLRSAGFRRATKLNSVDFSITGRNLALWTDYVGVDPESNQTQAGSQARGEDWFTNPSTKSYVFSIRISY